MIKTKSVFSSLFCAGLFLASISVLADPNVKGGSQAVKLPGFPPPVVQPCDASRTVMLQSMVPLEGRFKSGEEAISAAQASSKVTLHAQRVCTLKNKKYVKFQAKSAQLVNNKYEVMLDVYCSQCESK